MHLRIFSIVALLTTLVVASAWQVPTKSGEKYSKVTQEQWVDSVLNTMDQKQRIGQLFMVAAYSNRTADHVADIEKLIKDYNIGGLIFFQGGPVRQAILTNRYQALAKVPLLIAMDAEWGLGMRLDSTMSFPRQMTLGALQDDGSIYKMGVEVARQCKRLGVQVNFAPVIDVNSNPTNPVIGMRSFGEIKEKVAEKGLAYMKGMQDNHVMANAKHFPGHGDTGSDSHYTLPVITHDKERINKIDLYPFRELIEDSVLSIMVAHIHIPAYDSTPNKATTLSHAVVTDLLKNEMNFKGLIFTDALNMKGVSKFYFPGEVDLLALKAGNDVLLYAEDVPVAVGKIQESIECGELSMDDVNERIKKILRGKYFTKLHQLAPIDLNNLYEDLNNSSAKALQSQLYEDAITVVKNVDMLIPIKVLDTNSIATVSIGLEGASPLTEMVDNYAKAHHFSIPKNQDTLSLNRMVDQLKTFRTVLVNVHNTNNHPSKDFGITTNTRVFIEKLQEQTKVILTVFGSPYTLKFFTKINHLICAYEDNAITQKLAPQIIFAGLHPDGKIPVTAHDEIAVGRGQSTPASIRRLGYGYPEQVGMDSKVLSGIDTIATQAINDGATPGCQILVAKDGKVIYSKSFGYLTYEKTEPVNSNTLYDIASISKVAGTLQAVMFLTERGFLNLDKKASFYLPEMKKTNKEDLIVRDILTHQAGLKAYLPHWKKTVDSTNNGLVTYYCKVEKDSFNKEVIPGLYCITSIEDSLWRWTLDSELLPRTKTGKKLEPYPYVYSDLGFYIMKRIVEKLTMQPLEDFMQQNFYNPLGLSTMTYNPLEKFPASRIAPTEDDTVFRKAQIRGTVHDPGAALIGGVAGHAGVFSNANDLAILMQMNLWKGQYGGLKYFMPGTVPLFTRKQFPKNRRGLGWDKPDFEGKGNPTSGLVSPNTYGHTGFTGTATWVDPDQNLVYVFLSNRVFPDAANNKLVKQNVRTRIQDVIYKAIIPKGAESKGTVLKP
ncbi:MAG TPA: glycoside hydrolase family 3 N-terminal domain-containing protein [Cytophagaceae bacterium]|jgi:beta-glucosidase-like glycosyl hydrolase/CubicO group peptidase (beta-lactamase class C family)